MHILKAQIRRQSWVYSGFKMAQPKEGVKLLSLAQSPHFRFVFSHLLWLANKDGNWDAN